MARANHEASCRFQRCVTLRRVSVVAGGLIATKESDFGFRSVSNLRRFTMRSGTTFDLTAADRARLEAVVANRGSPQKHAWRARIT
eukprot:gene9527-12087_t